MLRDDPFLEADQPLLDRPPEFAAPAFDLAIEFGLEADDLAGQFLHPAGHRRSTPLREVVMAR
jgi:hypothetical protein